MSFNTEDDIKSRLKFLGSNMDQYDLSQILTTGNRKLKSAVGRKVEEELRLDRREQLVFDLAFTEIESVENVDFRDEKVPENEYTINKEKGEIEFNEDWAKSNYLHSDYRPVIEYVPTIFEELELMFALEEVMNLANIQTSSDERQAMFEQYRERRMELVRSINRKTQNLTSRNRGKTVASNYNWPGRR